VKNCFHDLTLYTEVHKYCFGDIKELRKKQTQENILLTFLPFMLFFYLWNQWQGSPLTGSLLLWKDKVLKSAGVQLDDTGLDGSSETANTTKPRGVKPCWPAGSSMLRPMAE
jgi:hypothetical protein